MKQPQLEANYGIVFVRHPSFSILLPAVGKVVRRGKNNSKCYASILNIYVTGTFMKMQYIFVSLNT